MRPAHTESLRINFELCLLDTRDCLLLHCRKTEAFIIIKAKSDNQYVSSVTRALI